MGEWILTCDIGGTNITVAPVVCDGDFKILDIAEYQSSTMHSVLDVLDNALEHFSALQLEYTCIAISAAGVVEGPICELSNLSWRIDTRDLEARYKLPIVLMNDFTAISYALPLIPLDDPKMVVPLTDVAEVPGETLAVVGAGTGLGVSALLRHKEAYICLESEAGHADVAPFDAITMELHDYYLTRLGNPPGAEVFVSGPGIARIFDFFVDSGRFPANAVRHAIMNCDVDRRPELINLHASDDPTCHEIMRIFVSLYARLTSSVALAYTPLGGMFIAGGVAQKVLSIMQRDGLFEKYFLMNYQGNIRKLLKRIPVFVICDYHISAMGAAHAAVQFRRL